MKRRIRMSFYVWASFDRTGSRSFRKLLSDIQVDSTAPQKADTLKEWEDYLKSKNVPEKTIRTLQEAWSIYWEQERREPYHDY